MISFAEEIESLRLSGQLSDRDAATVLPIERREVFSVHAELRLLTWAAVMLVVTGLGILLRNNLDRIGPLVLIVLIALAAASCYGWVVWKRWGSAGRLPSLVDDYILLLGALILSADIGYAEGQFHLLGDRWPQHLLLLAVLHGASAYLFDSRALLVLSVTSLTGWLGIGPAWVPETMSAAELGLRALIGSGLLLLWRTFNATVPERAHFHSVLDHAAALLALAGSLLLLFDSTYENFGIAAVLICAGAVISWSIRSGREAFVIYGVLTLLIAVDHQLIGRLRPGEVGVVLILLLSAVTAAMTLFFMHGRFRSDA